MAPAMGRDLDGAAIAGAPNVHHKNAKPRAGGRDTGGREPREISGEMTRVHRSTNLEGSVDRSNLCLAVSDSRIAGPV